MRASDRINRIGSDGSATFLGDVRELLGEYLLMLRLMLAI